jgi:hypothetical protein
MKMQQMNAEISNLDEVELKFEVVHLKLSGLD